MGTVLGLKDSSDRGSKTLSQKPSGVEYEFTRTYYVKASSSSETYDSILNSSGLPSLRQYTAYGYCRNKEATEVNASALLWEVECTYSSNIKEENDNLSVDWSIEEKEMVLYFDVVTGAPITNSVGEPLLASVQLPIPVLTITRREAFFDPDIILLYNGKVNSLPFYGAPAGTALMQGPTATMQVDNGQVSWSVTYKIKFNFIINPETKQPEGWILHLLDQGTVYKDDDDNYQKFESATGDPRTGNLNGSGGALQAGQPYYILKYNRYAPANFNLLNLGP